MEVTSGDIIAGISAVVILGGCIFGLGMKWATNKSKIDLKFSKLRDGFDKRIASLETKYKLLSLDRRKDSSKLLEDLTEILDDKTTRKHKDESDDG